MFDTIKGAAVVLDIDNISTDQIYPARHINYSDPREIAKYILTGVDKSLPGRLQGKVLVVADNFGCGSSREQAVIGLIASGVKAVIATSVGRIWYRNAINLGLPVIFCPQLSKSMKEGDELEISLADSTIKNNSNGSVFNAEPLSESILDILNNGGIKEMMRKKNS